MLGEECIGYMEWSGEWKEERWGKDRGDWGKLKPRKPCPHSACVILNPNEAYMSLRWNQWFSTCGFQSSSINTTEEVVWAPLQTYWIRDNPCSWCWCTHKSENHQVLNVVSDFHLGVNNSHQTMHVWRAGTRDHQHSSGTGAGWHGAT